MEISNETFATPSRRSFAVAGLTQSELYRVQLFVNEIRRSEVEGMLEEPQLAKPPSHNRTPRVRRRLSRQRLRLQLRRKLT